MSVTLDETVIDAPLLGLTTIGDVLTHVQAGRRLVVQMLVDGAEPDLSDIDDLRATPLLGRTLFVETADPGTLAIGVLSDVEASLGRFDELRLASAEAFRAGQPGPALEKLSAGFTLWQHIHASFAGVTQLLLLDLATLTTRGGATLESLLGTFAEHLRQLKSALETQDFVLCCDVLTYDMDQTTTDLRETVQSLRSAAGSARAAA